VGAYRARLGIGSQEEDALERPLEDVEWREGMLERRTSVQAECRLQRVGIVVEPELEHDLPVDRRRVVATLA